MRDGFGDTRLAGEMRIVANLQMAGYTDLTREAAIGADAGAAGQSGATGNGRARADNAVVRDMHLIVDDHVILNHRVIQGAAIDGHTGPDIDPVADAHRAQLMDLLPAPGPGRKTETVGADHRGGVHMAVFPDDNPIVDHHVGL